MKIDITIKTVLVLLLLMFTSCSNNYQQTLSNNRDNSNDALVIRTDFSQENIWNLICDKITKPSNKGFKAYVKIINDKANMSLTPNEVILILPNNYNHTFVFIVDSITIVNKEHPLLCVDVFMKKGKMFRVIPNQISTVENNLSIANMDFDEFANNVGSDGIFRGFK
jgi:hypothetical protein